MVTADEHSSLTIADPSSSFILEEAFLSGRSAGRLILAGKSEKNLFDSFTRAAVTLGPHGSAQLLLDASLIGAISRNKSMHRLLSLLEDESLLQTSLLANCLLSAILEAADDELNIGKLSGSILLWALQHSGKESLDARTASNIIRVLCRVMHAHANASFDFRTLPKVKDDLFNLIIILKVFGPRYCQRTFYFKPSVSNEVHHWIF